jgi:hypothetical protein
VFYVSGPFREFSLLPYAIKKLGVNQQLQFNKRQLNVSYMNESHLGLGNRSAFKREHPALPNKCIC